jgi:hypothetical protein
MLDPRYKDSIFSIGDQGTAFTFVVKELEQEKECLSNVKSESPPSKRSKPANNLNLMEATLAEMDDRRKIVKNPGLKEIEKVSLK